MTIFYHTTGCKCFIFFMLDCISDIKIIGFETYLYFSHQPQLNLLLQAASETACWIVKAMIIVNGNTVMIVCLIKLIWTDWNLYQKASCLVTCNRKASLLQSDILKFSKSLKLPCKQIFFWTNYLQTIFSSFCLLQTIFLPFFGTPR